MSTVSVPVKQVPRRSRRVGHLTPQYACDRILAISGQHLLTARRPG